MRSPPWRVLIADDEPAARRGVRQLLAGFSDFVVAGECRDGAEALASLDTLAPDIVFLDISMPGIDGFEVIRRRTPERMPAVVFLTAHDAFAIQAFEAQALDYLLKPVTQTRFSATMKRLTRQLGGEREPSLVVTTARGAAVVPFKEIDWIESADNYARIWTAGRSYLLREALRALEARVEPHGIVRAHRRALIRLGGIRRLTVTDAGEMHAVLSCGVKIPVSRRRRAAFAAAVKELSS